MKKDLILSDQTLPHRLIDDLFACQFLLCYLVRNDKIVSESPRLLSIGSGQVFHIQNTGL